MIDHRQEEHMRRLWDLKEKDPAQFQRLSTQQRLALGNWALDKGLAVPSVGEFYADPDMDAIIELRKSDPAGYARIHPTRRLKASHYEDEKNLHRFKTQKI